MCRSTGGVWKVKENSRFPRTKRIMEVPVLFVYPLQKKADIFNVHSIPRTDLGVPLSYPGAALQIILLS